VHTWFCPECGAEYELSQCARGRVLGFMARFFCPKCRRRVRLSGPAFIVLAMLGWIFLGMGGISWPDPILGLVLGVGIGLGAFRTVEQLLAEHRHRDGDDG
jgi:hypothetical protein